jgi:GPH family glycoside/pentoside/hexuronide:cation symporter
MSALSAREAAAVERAEDPRLTPFRKAVFALGDFSTNTTLAALSLVYTTYFLTQVAGLRPALAGLVPLIGRGLDAIADPVMGRISDDVRWRAGRRRPFFLLGAVPLGVTYALMWWTPPLESQAALFAYYTAIYLLYTLAVTVTTVPYLALTPEMALGYDARTSITTYRNAASVFGTAAAVGMEPAARALGGGAAGFAVAGVLFGIATALPWLAVWAASWERPELHSKESTLGMFEGMVVLWKHVAYRQLVVLYLCGRVAMDLVGATLLLYFTYIVGRPDDFAPTMLLFLATCIASLPVWLRVSRHLEKVTVFQIGAAWWMVGQTVILVAQPDWPRWSFIVIAPLLAIGYAVVDLMPWAMIGEVIDEDELQTGERREGIYNGFLGFLRKLGGAVAVMLALGILDLAGFQKGGTQTDEALLTIRLVTSVAPAAFLAAAVWASLGYPLTREAHAAIIAKLTQRALRSAKRH